MKKILTLLLALSMLLSMAACGSTQEQPTATTVATEAPAVQETVAPTEAAVNTVESLTIAITKDENTLSPFTYVSGTGLTVNRLIYDTSVCYGSE